MIFHRQVQRGSKQATIAFAKLIINAANQVQREEKMKAHKAVARQFSLRREYA